MVKYLWLILWLPLWAWADSLPINTKLGGDFELSSTQGEAKRLSDFAGQAVLLNFGFTHCPHICPTVLNRMAQVRSRLGDQANEVQGLFITIDPERDSLARMGEYLAQFDSTFVGFYGSPEQLNVVGRQYGVIAIPQPGDAGEGMNYAHGDYIYLLDRRGRVRALYGQDDSIGTMVEDIKGLLNEA